jgi:mannose-6-phosphate isomerase
VKTPARLTPTALALNTPQRFYRGGERILAFRGLPVPEDFDGRRPEDWLASTTRLFAEGGDGLTVLPDGRTLADAVTTEPERWLGAAHVADRGTDTALLTKLLDSGERLPVHSHPDRAFAARHLDCAHGKTEAWIILEAEPGATVWVGFRDGLTQEELTELVEAQDDRLLAALNPISVTAGDAVLVPAGQPHAIGEGVLLLELQEPTDFSVMLEHRRFGLEEAHAFLGLPRSTALTSVALGPLESDGVARLRRRWVDVRGSGPALPDEASDFFRAQVLSAEASGPAVTAEAAFAVTLVVQGAGQLRTATDPETTPSTGDQVIDLEKGDVLLVPHAAGEISITGDVTVIRCMPPMPPEGGR